MYMIKGVIFDLDGVIVHTDKYHYLAWKNIADLENIYFDGEEEHITYYEYDEFGNLITQIFPSGKKQEYTYIYNKRRHGA